jgi:hypothetical protein
MAVAQLALVDDEPDTQVADVEDLPMQVRTVDDDGLMRWHRWLPGSNGSETACGNLVDHHLILGTRYETCSGEMCPDCFTARELVKAALANAAERGRNR